jgi:hypothetical protein
MRPRIVKGSSFYTSGLALPLNETIHLAGGEPRVRGGKLDVTSRQVQPLAPTPN